MLKRVITGVVLLAVAGALIALQGWFLRAGVLVMALVSFHEMYNAFKQKDMHAVRWPGFVFCVLSSAVVAFESQLAWMGGSAISMVFIACAMVGMIAVILKGQPDFNAIVATVFPMLYPGMFYVFFMSLQNLEGRGVTTLALIMAILMSAMNDTMALFVGRAIGKKKLCPGISPKKTVAGSVAGIITSAVFAVAIPVVFTIVDVKLNGAEGAAQLAPYWAFAIFGVAAGIISQLGDLMASLIKRFCGIKDFGKLFPGHGGMMDRLDAILFSCASCYIFFALMGH